MVLLLLLFIEWRERQSFYPHLSFTHSYPLGAFQGHQGVTLFWQVTVNLSSPLSPYENVALMLSYKFFSCLLSIIFWTFLNIIFFLFHFWYSFFRVQPSLCVRACTCHMANIFFEAIASQGQGPHWVSLGLIGWGCWKDAHYAAQPWTIDCHKGPHWVSLGLIGWGCRMDGH